MHMVYLYNLLLLRSYNRGSRQTLAHIDEQEQCCEKPISFAKMSDGDKTGPS